MSKELTPLEALEKLTNYKYSCMSEKIECKNIIKTALKRLESVDRVGEMFCVNVDKKLKALEIIKENLVVSYDESNNDKPCLMLSIKVGKDNLVVIYETFDKEKIDLLKEVLL